MGLYFWLGGEVALLKAVADGCQAWEHHGVSGVNHVADPVAYPVGVAHGECHGIGSGGVVAFGTLGGAAVDGGVGNHVAIVVAEPEYSANLAGQPAAHLADV